MADKIDELFNQLNELKKIVNNTSLQVKELQAENQKLEEELAYYKKKFYGRRTEKLNSLLPDPEQGTLFDLEYPEQDPADAQPPAESQDSNKTSRQKRRKGRRQDILANLPHEEKIIEPADDEKKCPYCSSEMSKIGKKYLGSKVEIIPAQIIVNDYFTPVYKCPQCEESGESTIVAAKANSNVDGGIPQSVATPSLLAYILGERYAKGLPYNRLAAAFKQMGFNVDRKMLSNWAVYAAKNWLKVLYDCFHEMLKRRPYLHADETPFMVLNEKDRKNTSQSYMWVYSTIREDPMPIRLYDYNPSRAGKVVNEFLGDFSGVLITDGWQAYNAVENADRSMCWAHARRMFVDAIPADKAGLDKDSIVVKGLYKIRDFFAVEKEISALTPADKYKQRQIRLVPMVKEFFEWVQRTVDESAVSSEKLRKALNYCLNHKKELCKFLNDGNIPATNSLCERTVRPFTVGRKNWMFAGSPKGAETSAIVYSIVETAKANLLNPHKYLLYLLQEIPKIKDHTSESLEKLFPWSPEVLLTCKIS